MMRICVCVFAKPPVAGQVNTRLIPTLSAQQACGLHKNFLKHCISQIQHVSWDVQLWSTDIQHAYLKQCAQQNSMSLYEQQGDDLGERMLLAMKESLKTFSYVIIIGSDCPDLDAEYIGSAITALKKGVDVVLGPAEDGGYVLIGMSVDVSAVFENIQWGSDQVLAVTRQRLKEMGIRWHELATQRDIDRPDDLVFLQQQHPLLLTL